MQPVHADHRLRVDGARRTAAGNRAAGAGQRWSVARKRAVVLQLLGGESMELLSRELGVPVYKLERWRAKAEAGSRGR